MIFLIENIFLFLGIFAIVLYVWMSKVSQKKIVVDHVVLLFFGFIFYFYFPMFSFLNDNFTNDMQKISFYELSKPNRQNISLIFLGLILVTIFADIKSKKLNLYPSRLGTPSTLTLLIILVTLTIMLSTVIIQMIPFMFSSYDSADWIRGVRGPFLSYIVVLITMSCMYLSNRKSLKMRDLLNIFTIFAFIFSLMNLLSGNRGFFITLIVSIVIAASHHWKGVRIERIFIVFLLGVLVAGIIGMTRRGGFEGVDGDFFIMFNTIRYQFLAESANVFTSLVQYMNLEFANINLIEFPKTLLSQFINIIPSFIFPSKFDYISIDIRAPYFLASSHFFVILAVNFGLIGSFIFFYYFVYILNYIKIKYRLTGIYIAISAHIPFMFFRDFELTLVKFMFEFSFIFAVIVLISGNTLKTIFKKTE